MMEQGFVQQIEALEQLSNMEYSHTEEMGFTEMPKDPRETLNELLEKFLYAENWRLQYDQKATEWYKLYVGYKARAKERQGKSGLHIPRTYEQIDTLRARIVKSFMSNRPYVDFVPKSAVHMTLEMLEENEKKASLASAQVDHQLELNNIVTKFYDHITSMLIFPAAIMGVEWGYEKKIVKRKEPIEVPVINPSTGTVEIDWSNVQPIIDPRTGQPLLNPQTGQFVPDMNTIKPLTQTVTQIVEKPEVVWDDNKLINIDYYDFFPDPRGTNIDNARFCFHREWATKDEVENKLRVLEKAETGFVYYPDWEKVDTEGAHSLEEGRWERITSVGLQPETSDGRLQGKSMGLYEVLNYWENDRHCMIINRSELIYDGPSPYWRHGKKPFVVSVFEPLPNEFYGLSGVQVIEHLQHELNTIRNQRVDNSSMILNRMWKVRRGADIDESELVSRPNGIIWVDNPDDVTELAMRDMVASGYNEESIVKMDMENALAVPSVIRGADSSRRETATEVVTKSTNAGMRFDVKIMLFEATGFKRMVQLMDLNNQQFVDEDRLIYLTSGDPEVADSWREVKPWEIVGEFDYRPAGANIDPAANKEMRRQQLIQVLQIAASTQSPYIKQQELWQELLNTFDFRNSSKFFKTEEELRQEQLQQMALMQMMQQQQQQQRSPQEQQAQPPAGMLAQGGLVGGGM